MFCPACRFFFFAPPTLQVYGDLLVCMRTPGKGQTRLSMLAASGCRRQASSTLHKGPEASQDAKRRTTATTGSSGRTEVAFNMCYVCRAGGAAWPCDAAIESQLRDRLKDQLDASGQRRYCERCEAR